MGRGNPPECFRGLKSVLGLGETLKNLGGVGWGWLQGQFGGRESPKSPFFGGVGGCKNHPLKELLRLWWDAQFWGGKC